MYSGISYHHFWLMAKSHAKVVQEDPTMPTIVIPEAMQSLLNEGMTSLKIGAGASFETVLDRTFTRMAEDVRDVRDIIVETIEDEDRYRGREVVQIVDDAIKLILESVEQNLPSTEDTPGLTHRYFDLINS